MLNPIIPAPMITTSNEWDARVGSIAEPRAGPDRSALIFLVEKERILWGNLEPKKFDSPTKPHENSLLGGEAKLVRLAGESIGIAAMDY